MLVAAPWWWWRRDRQSILSEGTTMIILGILLSFAAIGFFCWLLFTLAVFALPFFAGVSLRAYGPITPAQAGSEPSSSASSARRSRSASGNSC
jgi:hypothetical protein